MDFLTDPRALLVYVLIFAEGFLCWGAVTYLGAFARRRHGLDQLQIGLLIALFGVGTMVGGSLMAPLRRRLSGCLWRHRAAYFRMIRRLLSS